MSPKKPSAEVTALLARAKKGAWLTKVETERLLGFNQGYTFRYISKESRNPPKEKEARDLWETETFKASLTDTSARWRMLGRSEPIQQPIEEFVSLYVTQNQGGGYDWDVVDEYDVLVAGKEATAFRAAIVGGKAYEVELHKRELVEPEDFMAKASPAEVFVPWGLFTLIKWAAEKIADADTEGPPVSHIERTFAEDIADFLTVEGLRDQEVPKEAYKALRSYRKQNAKARIHGIESLLRAMGLLKEAT